MLETKQLTDEPADCCILLSTQRSGTTLLSEHLANHGHFGRASERYLILERQTPPPSFAPSFFFELVARRKERQSEYAINLMANQLPSATKRFFGLDQEKHAVTLQQQTQFLDAFAGVFRNPIAVRLKRKDKLAQAISLIIHSRTGVAHIRDGQTIVSSRNLPYEKREQVVASITAHEVAKWIEKIDKWETNLDAICASLRTPQLMVYYEDLSKNPLNVLSKIFTTAGISPPSEIALPKLQVTSGRDEARNIIYRLCGEIGVDRNASNDDICSNLRQLSHFQFKLQDLTRERNHIAAERDRLAVERDRLAAERDILAAERDNLKIKYKKSMRDPIPHLALAYSKKVKSGLAKATARFR